MSRKWRVYCSTEGLNVFITSSTMPTVCPNNAGHTIVANSVCLDNECYEADRIFGDGADGDVTISTNTSLTRDMYYRNLTITSAAEVDVDGWRIFVADTLTMTNGHIHCDGIAGSAGGGASNVARSLGIGSAGGAGGATGANNGVAGSSVTANTMMGGRGGAGGARSSASGGAAGTAQTPAVTVGGTGWFRCAEIAVTGRNVTYAVMNGGTGGGGGAGGTSAAGGRGGGGAGVVVVAARRLAYTSGSVSADGGNGAAGNASGGGGGGGAGGGGCVVFISCDDSSAITMTVNGGTGGAAGGAAGAVAGSVGTAGNIFRLRV